MTQVKVQIEIPYGQNIKYEINHENHELICDRFLYVPFLYPFTSPLFGLSRATPN